VTITLDTSVLLGYYQSKYGGTSATTSGGATASTAKPLPTAPWETDSGAPRSSDLVRQVLAGRKFVDPNAAQLDVKGASEDYRKLFALFQGLNALNGLAERADTKGVTRFELDQVTRSFTSGMTQVAAYLDTLKLDQIRLSRGDSVAKDRTEVGVKRDDPNYVTGTLHTGTANDEVAAFLGEVKFDIAVKKGATPATTTTTSISIDLAEMGSTTRSMSNVVAFINQKLTDAGVRTRVAVERTPGEPRVITSGSQSTTLPALADSFALKVKGDLFETVSFAAPASARAVYLAGATGKDANAANQLFKFQTDQTTTTAPPPAFIPGGSTFSVDGRVFAKPMGVEVSAVRQTATGADGSLYALADVTGTTNGQTIKGAKDVALIKYDSAGNVVYTRTLGAADTASGMALSVSPDGKIAVAGAVTGVLNTGDPHPLGVGADATKSDSFVTVFSAAGDELWTQRRAASAEDEATAVAFGDDGTVYVSGRAKSGMPGASSLGDYDGYLQAFTWNGKSGDASVISTKTTQQFGTSGADSVAGMAIEGDQVVIAGVENGHAVVRRFDIQPDGSSVAGAVRDLGPLQGGSIAGVSLKNGEVIIAGTTSNPSLSAGAVTTGHGGGTDAFVARLDASLTPGAGDRLTYLGGDGDATASDISVVDGKVWLTGTVKGAMPGTTAVGDQDGYLVRLDASTGAQEWSRRFSGPDRTVGPLTIAVAPSSASVLDRLGLPSGAIVQTDSQLLTANSSVRAGDQFQIRTNEGGRAQTVTISADDTLKTLATKISRAAGFQVKVAVVKDGDFDKLEIKANSNRTTVEITAGPGSRDALEALGLSEGVVRNTLLGSEAKAAEKIYGLKLDNDLNLSTPAGIKAAMANLQDAMTVIRNAYRDLEAASKPEVKAPTGPAPAYLTSQIANYTAALNRLTGAA
jgi:hypothetical protein